MVCSSGKYLFWLIACQRIKIESSQWCSALFGAKCIYLIFARVWRFSHLIQNTERVLSTNDSTSILLREKKSTYVFYIYVSSFVRLLLEEYKYSLHEELFYFVEYLINKNSVFRSTFDINTFWMENLQTHLNQQKWKRSWFMTNNNF